MAQPQFGFPDPDQERAQVDKCARFFRTLIVLANNESDPNHVRLHAAVKELSSQVIFGEISAYEFTERLQALLGSQDQPHLLPFLQRTLEPLSIAIARGEIVIEGIQRPTPNYLPNNPV